MVKLKGLNYSETKGNRYHNWRFHTIFRFPIKRGTFNGKRKTTIILYELPGATHAYQVAWQADRYHVGENVCNVRRRF